MRIVKVNFWKLQPFEPDPLIHSWSRAESENVRSHAFDDRRKQTNTEEMKSSARYSSHSFSSLGAEIKHRDVRGIATRGQRVRARVTKSSETKRNVAFLLSLVCNEHH